MSNADVFASLLEEAKRNIERAAALAKAPDNAQMTTRAVARAIGALTDAIEVHSRK